MKAERILLASHGTIGALAADRMALRMCSEPDVELFHLTVVPELWRGMMGDDWLNDVSTRDAYCKHVESELGKEIEGHRRTLEPQLALRRARYHARVTIGTPAECLLRYSDEVQPDLIVLGSPRPRGTPGLRSRMRLERLFKSASASLLIVPYPR